MVVKASITVRIMRRVRDRARRILPRLEEVVDGGIDDDVVGIGATCIQISGD